MTYSCTDKFGSHSHVWLESTSDVATTTGELNFKFHLILINLIFDSHLWPRATFYWTVCLEKDREEHSG